MLRIAIIGCGNMGLTYAKAFLKDNIVSQKDLLLIEKNAEMKERLRPFGNVSNKIDERIKGFDIIILATKPQDSKAIYADLRKYIMPSHLLISIMAGITIQTLQDSLGHKAIVRAMPNTPAQLGMGITGFTASKDTNIKDVLKADNLLNSTGKTIFFDDESKLDAVTALSGSGPAYFYFIASAMIEAGKQMGIDEHISSLLVKQTMNGAFHLMNTSENNLDDLIQSVASKGGTTEAALTIFKDQKLKEALVNGIIAAEKRAKELSKS
ncbi:MAG: pyrroline-5-carboxylate reductase [Bacteroidia bacterium]|jgi:pyrroline-5-carboxylate reductase|nr:pyrroline-5-carboxylate reductase [Bacteroidia bacterium]